MSSKKVGLFNSLWLWVHALAQKKMSCRSLQLDLSPDGRTLACVGGDECLNIWRNCFPTRSQKSSFSNGYLDVFSTSSSLMGSLR
jgi:hypothetical protein